MIEIALDKNFETDVFHNLPRPALTIKDFSGTSIDDYRQQAKKIITAYADEQIVILRINTPSCSLNMLALALFIESCLIKNKLECVVFKVQNYEQALASYKPFVALTIAIRLALRLFRLDSIEVYRELENMQYLGLDIRIDYQNNKIFSSLPGSGDIHTFITHTTTEALAAAATLKALSLAKTGAAVNIEINRNPADAQIDIDEVIRLVINNVKPWIN